MVVLTLATTAACAGSTATSDTGATTPRATATSPPPHASEPAPSATSVPDQGPITLTFAGDVHFEARLRSRLDNPATALATIASQLSAADLTVVNLETSIGTSGAPEPKRYTFQAPAAAFDALAAAGVDVVTMANNHAMDFGPDGLADTLTAIPNAPLRVVGVGPDAASAYAPAVVDIAGTAVAVIGAHSADDPTADPTEQWAAGSDTPGVAVARDPARLVAAVREAGEVADVVVVFMHWGVQGDQCPSASQAATAQALADAGADVVVGSHAHVVQGSGLFGDVYVAYGLGNFVWYRPGPAALLTVTVDGGRVVDEVWAPARIGSDGLPQFATGADGRRQVADFAQRRACTGLTPVR